MSRSLSPVLCARLVSPGDLVDGLPLFCDDSRGHSGPCGTPNADAAAIARVRAIGAWEREQAAKRAAAEYVESTRNAVAYGVAPERRSQTVLAMADRQDRIDAIAATRVIVRRDHAMGMLSDAELREEELFLAAFDASL